MGISVKDEKELISFIGPPLKDSFRDGFNFNEEEVDTAMRLFRERYSVKGLYENTLFDDTKELLKMLKDQKRHIFLATSKPTEYAKLILRHFDIEKYFDGVYGASMDETLVEKADILTKAIKEEDVEIKNSIMVGDRVHDIQGAKEVGMDSIFLALGYANETEAQMLSDTATYDAENMKELCSLFLKI